MLDATTRPRPTPILRAPKCVDLSDRLDAAWERLSGCQRWHATARMAPLERVRTVPWTIGEILGYGLPAIALVAWVVWAEGRIGGWW